MSSAHAALLQARIVRAEGRAASTEDATPMPVLVIACSSPGLARAGAVHPAMMTHLLTRFSPGQLRELLDEPHLALVIGRPLTFADVAAIERGETIDAHEMPPPTVLDPEAGAAVDKAAPAKAKHVKGTAR